MSPRLVGVCILLIVGTSCRRSAPEPAPIASPAPPASVALPGAPADSTAPGKTKLQTTSVVSEKTKDTDELQSEEREANPTSETVTLTLNISPPVKALVMWGAKTLARLTPAAATVELERPRSSGPLDIEIRAEGFLPHHTRLHSDRNDKVNVRLVRPADASSLHGFRSSTSAAAAKVKTK